MKEKIKKWGSESGKGRDWNAYIRIRLVSRLEGIVVSSTKNNKKKRRKKEKKKKTSTTRDGRCSGVHSIPCPSPYMPSPDRTHPLQSIFSRQVQMKEMKKEISNECGTDR